MNISHVELWNWKNFRNVNVSIPARVFLVGPNASGKSNFLDALRFLRTLAIPGGGLQSAVEERRGLSHIRCLAAPQESGVGITVVLSDGKDAWKYALCFNQEAQGRRRPVLTREAVFKNDNLILERPDPDDQNDRERLTQTALEQVNLNARFREIAQFFEKISYLHLTPQIVRNSYEWTIPNKQAEAYGYHFVDRLAKTPEKIRAVRLRRILKTLKEVVPQLESMGLKNDENGIPHLFASYTHWQQKLARQDEETFSDGVLRLIGLLWSLQEGDGPLLLEEPELSLHSGIVRRLPGLIHRIQSEKKRQIVISTHSADLLCDEGIGGEEVLLFTPRQDGAQIVSAVSQPEIRSLLEAGVTAADAVLPHTDPENFRPRDPL